jgi:hypothetical protein
MSLDDIINLSYLAKEYYDFVNRTNDKKLFDLSLKHIKKKQYDNISPGYKERCVSILFETLLNVNDSETFYQKILFHASYCEEMIKSFYELINDMLMFCQTSSFEEVR